MKKNWKKLLFVSFLALALVFGAAGVFSLRGAPAHAEEPKTVPFKEITTGTEFPRYGSGIRYSQPLGAIGKNSILWPTLANGEDRSLVVAQNPAATIDLSDPDNFGGDYEDAALTFWLAVDGEGALANMQQWQPDTGGSAWIGLSDQTGGWSGAHDNSKLYIDLIPALNSFQVGWNKVSAKLSLAAVQDSASTKEYTDYLQTINALRFVFLGSTDTYNYAISDVRFALAAEQTDPVVIAAHEEMTHYLTEGHVSEVAVPADSTHFPGATAYYLNGGPNDAPYFTFNNMYEKTGTFKIEIDETAAADYSYPAISMWLYISNIQSFRGIGDSQLEFRTMPFTGVGEDAAQGERIHETNMPLSGFKNDLKQGWNRLLISLFNGYGGSVKDISSADQDDRDKNHLDLNDINYMRLYAVGGSGYSGYFGLSDIRIVETTYINANAATQLAGFIPVANTLSVKAYVGKDTALRGLLGENLTYTVTEGADNVSVSAGVMTGLKAGAATITANNDTTGDYNTITVTVLAASNESAVLVDERAENTYAYWPGVVDAGPERTAENGRRSLRVFPHGATHMENWFSLGGTDRVSETGGATGGRDISGVPNPALNFMLYVSHPDEIKLLTMQLAVNSGLRRFSDEGIFTIDGVDGYTTVSFPLSGVRRGWNEITVPLADAARDNADLTNVTSVVFKVAGANGGTDDFYVHNITVVESDAFSCEFRPYPILSAARAYVGKTTALRNLSGSGLTYAVTAGGDYASVNAATGVVTGIAAGTATITANNVAADEYNTVTVTVTAAEGTGSVALVNSKAEDASACWRPPELFAPGWTAAGQDKSFPLIVHGADPTKSEHIENWINIKGSSPTVTGATGGADVSGLANPTLKFNLYVSNAAYINAASLTVGINSGARRSGTDNDFSRACDALWEAGTNFTKFAIPNLQNGWNAVSLPIAFASIDNCDLSNVTCVVFRFSGANNGQAAFAHNIRIEADDAGNGAGGSVSATLAQAAAAAPAAWDSDPENTFAWQQGGAQFIDKSLLNTPASMNAAYTKFAYVNGSLTEVNFGVDFDLSGIAAHNISRLAFEIWIYVTDAEVKVGNAGGRVFGFALYNANTDHGVVTSEPYGAAGIYNWMGAEKDEGTGRVFKAGWNRVRVSLGSSGFMGNVDLSKVNLLKFDPRINDVPAQFIISNPRIVYQGDTSYEYQDSFTNIWRTAESVEAPASLSGVGLAAQPSYAVPSDTAYPALEITGLTAGAGVFVWSSENPSVVSVDPWTGALAFVGEGTAAIRLTLLGAADLYVAESVTSVGPALTGAAIDTSGLGARGTWNADTKTLTLLKSDSFVLSAALLDAGVMNVTDAWSTSDSGVIAVDPATGRLLIHGNGTVVIKLTASKGELSFEDEITVIVDCFVVLESLSIDDVSLADADPFTVEYRVAGQNLDKAGPINVVYSSADTGIVIVNGDGDLVAVANGAVKVTATVTVNGVTKTTEFTVTVTGLKAPAAADDDSGLGTGGKIGIAMGAVAVAGGAAGLIVWLVRRKKK
ncbi:MAG: hypothetical protein LBL66_03330 [Clostridiales bacterium]|jgi:uncharacterized protein YjdB|nr:hypothetical protein [Clostridiales bacterium]